MTAHSTRKKRARFQQDFIPNFEIRSMLVIATFAMGAVAAHAQTAATTLSTNPDKPQVAVVDRSDSATKSVAQNRASKRQRDAAFNRADRNGDGKLSREEAEHFPLLVERFDAIDDNHDSFLSHDEFERAAGD